MDTRASNILILRKARRACGLPIMIRKAAVAQVGRSYLCRSAAGGTQAFLLDSVSFPAKGISGLIYLIRLSGFNSKRF
jgi:hypothetical protein